MSSVPGKLRENFERLARTLTALPPVPSITTAAELKRLESLKVNNPSDSSYHVRNRAPLISGVKPERIVVEVRKYQNVHFFTYWYFWSSDRFLRDHKDWEPVTLVYNAEGLDRIDARIHNALIHYTPYQENPKPKVYFSRIGHTPILEVKDREKDIILQKLNDERDSTRRKWLDFCYQNAVKNGWLQLAQPQIEWKNGPILDISNWKRWGKHSIYLKI